MSTFNGFISEFRGVVVDTFSSQTDSGAAFFLSHCHVDHMRGLERKDVCREVLYCSKISKRLLANTPKYSHLTPWLSELEFNHPTPVATIPNLVVTMINANHCPGSAMFLFESDTTRVLYTGDCRFEEDEAAEAHYEVIRDMLARPIDALYLDTTFFVDMVQDIPSRRVCVDKVIELVESHGEGGHVFIATKTKYGYERMYKGLADHFGCKVHVTPDKLAQYSGMPEMQAVLTTDAKSTRIHACDWHQRGHHVSINRHSGQSLSLPCLRGYAGMSRPLLFIKLSAIIFARGGTPEDGYLIGATGARHVPFSMHSTHRELRDFISLVRPKEIIPCVVPKGDSAGGLKERLDTVLVELGIAERTTLRTPNTMDRWLVAVKRPKPQPLLPGPIKRRKSEIISKDDISSPSPIPLLKRSKTFSSLTFTAKEELSSGMESKPPFKRGFSLGATAVGGRGLQQLSDEEEDRITTTLPSAQIKSEDTKPIDPIKREETAGAVVPLDTGALRAIAQRLLVGASQSSSVSEIPAIESSQSKAAIASETQPAELCFLPRSELPTPIKQEEILPFMEMECSNQPIETSTSIQPIKMEYEICAQASSEVTVMLKQPVSPPLLRVKDEPKDQSGAEEDGPDPPSPEYNEPEQANPIYGNASTNHVHSIYPKECLNNRIAEVFDEGRVGAEESGVVEDGGGESEELCTDCGGAHRDGLCMEELAAKYSLQQENPFGFITTTNTQPTDAIANPIYSSASPPTAISIECVPPPAQHDATRHKIFDSNSRKDEPIRNGPMGKNEIESVWNDPMASVVEGSFRVREGTVTMEGSLPNMGSEPNKESTHERDESEMGHGSETASHKPTGWVVKCTPGKAEPDPQTLADLFHRFANGRCPSQSKRSLFSADP